MENVQSYSYATFATKVENSLRIHSLFVEERCLLSVISSKNSTVGTSADQLNSVVTSAFEILKREVFSLPKLAYLPGILIREPLLVLLLLPANIGLDFARAKVISHLNSRTPTLTSS